MIESGSQPFASEWTTDQFEKTLGLALNLDSPNLPVLLKLLQDLPVRQVYCYGKPDSFYGFVRKMPIETMRSIEWFIQFSLTPAEWLKKYPSRAAELPIKTIFTSNNYTINSRSWGMDVLELNDNSAEIHDLHPDHKTIRCQIPRPQHIMAIYAVALKRAADIKPGHLLEVTSYLDPLSGQLEFESKEDKRILVIRQMHGMASRPLFENLNLFNRDLLDFFMKRFHSELVPGKTAQAGVFFDTRELMHYPHGANFCIYSSELDDEDRPLLRMIARHWLLAEKSSVHGTIFFRRVFDGWLHKKLKPLLDSAAHEVKYVSPVDQNLLNQVTRGIQFQLTVDEERFVFDTPYYWQTFIQIKLNRTRRYAANNYTVPVIMHQLLNIGHSFGQKKYQFELLAAAGANRYFLKHDLSDLPPRPADIGQDPNFPFYQFGYGYLNELSRFLSEGIPRKDILALYPSLDSDHALFLETMKTLCHLSFDFTLMPFELFNDRSICKIRNQHIVFKNIPFSVVVLPAVSVLPVETKRKLYAFYKSGGIVIAFGRLPQKIAGQASKKTLENWKRKMWLEDHALSSVMYQQHESGGRGYFQPDLSRAAILFEELRSHLNIFLQSEPSGTFCSVRETANSFLIFVLNPRKDREARIKIRTRYMGRPYTWDFLKKTKNSLGVWSVEDDRLEIALTVRPAASRMIILDKTESTSVYQVQHTDLDDIHVDQQERSEIKLTGWKRREGLYKTVIKTNSISDVLQYELKHKLPLLAINSDNWLLHSSFLKGNVRLSDLSRQYPFFCEAIEYKKNILIPPEYLENKKLVLDLGGLSVWCSVYLNKKFVGHLFAPPWQTDITSFAEAGENLIHLKIYNNLCNKLAEQDISQPVQEYGLFGPVRIIPYNLVHLSI